MSLLLSVYVNKLLFLWLFFCMLYTLRINYQATFKSFPAYLWSLLILFKNVEFLCGYENHYSSD